MGWQKVNDGVGKEAGIVSIEDMFDLVIFLDGLHYMRTSLEDGRDSDEVRLGDFQEFIVLRVLRLLKLNGFVL